MNKTQIVEGAISRIIWSGILACLAISSLFQDYFGKVAYIEHINNHWVSWTITVPMAIIMLIVGAWLKITGESKIKKL